MSGTIGMPQVRSLNFLTGRPVEYVRLAHATVLGLSGGTQILIEACSRLNGRLVEPGDDAHGVLLGRVVRAARTTAGGELRMTFDAGFELSVGADAQFESWAVTGPGDLLIVCLARGEVAFWGDGDAYRRTGHLPAA